MSNNKHGTINVHILLSTPIKQNGDKRYSDPQFCNKNGKRDMRYEM